MARVLYTLSACQDCLMLTANGDLPEDRPDLESEIGAHLRLEPLQHLVCGGAGQDDEFSWQPCECCGSRLGGSRHQLMVMQTS